jgi:ankyrin repeat protein
VDCLDEKTGNTPIHIAAQNGFLAIVQMLIDHKCNLNVKNKKGNTAMHMAIAYDYFETVDALLQNGADPTITNDAGFEASRGLENDKSAAMVAVAVATDEASILKAFDLVEAKKDECEKSKFVALCLARKKVVGDKWTEAVKTRMADLMKILPSKGP